MIDTDHLNSIYNEMLPVRVERVSYPTESGNSVKTAYYVLSNDGHIISNALPRHWAEYMENKTNSNDLLVKPSVALRKPSKLIASILIKEEPMDHWEGRTARQEADGKIVIECSQDFQRMIKRVKRVKKAKIYGGNFPITVPVEMACIFYVPSKRHCNLPNLIATAQKVLYEIGVFKQVSYNIVKSVDKSEIIYSDNPEEWGVQIYLREWRDN